MPQTTLSCPGTLYLPKLQVWVQFHVHKAKGNLKSRGEIQLITRLHSIEMGHEVLGVHGERSTWRHRVHGTWIKLLYPNDIELVPQFLGLQLLGYLYGMIFNQLSHLSMERHLTALVKRIPVHTCILFVCCFLRLWPSKRKKILELKTRIDWNPGCWFVFKWFNKVQLNLAPACESHTKYLPFAALQAQPSRVHRIT